VGRINEAIKFFDTHTSAVDAQLYKGIILGKLGKYDESLKCYYDTIDKPILTSEQ
jgi:hypothetical protein